jgi:hypothetical protein
MKPGHLLLHKFTGIDRAMRENFEYETKMRQEHLAKITSNRDTLLHSRDHLESILSVEKQRKEAEARRATVEEEDGDIINIARDQVEEAERL